MVDFIVNLFAEIADFFMGQNSIEFIPRKEYNIN